MKSLKGSMARRFTSIVIAAAVMISGMAFFAPGISLADEIKEGTVTADLLNARELPIPEAQLAFVVLQGTKVDVIGSNDEWVKIAYKKHIGWIKKEFVSITEDTIAVKVLEPYDPSLIQFVISSEGPRPAVTLTPVPTPKPTPKPTPTPKPVVGKDAYINGDNVNFRSQGSVDASVYEKLAKNTVIVAYEQSNSFTKVKYKGAIGWVSSGFVSYGKPAPPSPPSTGSTYTSKTAYIDGSNVNVRESASSGSEVVSHLQNATKLTVTGEQGDWYKIKCSNVVGWISKAYISFTAPTDENGNGSGNPASGNQATAANVVAYAKTFLGCPYVYGGMSPSGFDCSGFTSYVFKKFGISLNRSAAGQRSNGVYVAKGNLQPGDLVCFNGHSGIYIGNGQYINSASGSSMKVIISNLSDNWSANNYIMGRRVL